MSNYRTPQAERIALPDDVEAFLSADDVAAWLGMSTRHIYVTRDRDQMPGTLGFKVGRSLKFDPADIRAYIADQKATTQKSSAARIAS